MVHGLTPPLQMPLSDFDHPLHAQLSKVCCLKQRQKDTTEESDHVPGICCDYLQENKHTLSEGSTTFSFHNG